jgi:hypothetical protein
MRLHTWLPPRRKAKLVVVVEMSLTFITGYLFISTLMLIYNTYKDIRFKEIDSRWNFMAFGSTIMLLDYFTPKFSLILIVSIAVSVILFIFSYKKFFASGDIEALSWTMFALGIFDYSRMILFLVFLTVLYSINLIIIKIFKLNNEIVGYPVILSSWLITLISFFFKF